jgi:DNA polymerase-3 subunit epsilon
MRSIDPGVRSVKPATRVQHGRWASVCGVESARARLAAPERLVVEACHAHVSAALWRVHEAVVSGVDADVAHIATVQPEEHEIAGLLSLARLVAVDLETTGPKMYVDRIISIGAVAVADRAVQHADAFEVVIRQEHESAVDNILVHQIGGQEQRSGTERVSALLSFLEFLDGSACVAFRAEFDATVLRRELQDHLGIVLRMRWLNLAYILPALFPATQNDTLDEWTAHFGLPPMGRHHAIADAYAVGQLLLRAMDQAQRIGMVTAGDLLDMDRAQRWLGRRR